MYTSKHTVPIAAVAQALRSIAPEIPRCDFFRLLGVKDNGARPVYAYWYGSSTKYTTVMSWANRHLAQRVSAMAKASKLATQYAEEVENTQNNF